MSFNAMSDWGFRLLHRQYIVIGIPRNLEQRFPDSINIRQQVQLAETESDPMDQECPVKLSERCMANHTR